MTDREEMIAWLRGEIVGPSRPLTDSTCIEFQEKLFVDPVPVRSGPLGWRPVPDSQIQEVVYFQREAPYRKYGVGLLHPDGQVAPDEVAAKASDTLGAENETDESITSEESTDSEENADEIAGEIDPTDTTDDFEVTSADVRRPSTLGLSFCVRLKERSRLIVRFPQVRRFGWQAETSSQFSVNGRYESCTRRWTDAQGVEKEAPMWRRHSAVLPDTVIAVNSNELVVGQVVRKDLQMPDGSPLRLRVEVFSRRLQNLDDVYLLTLVLRNSSQPDSTANPQEATLYQTYFEAIVENGTFEKYPESQRPFDELDRDEQTLSLLYQESATWAIGHGCAAGWDAEPNETPNLLYADVMPAVETPSVTPDITDAKGEPIRLSMRDLSTLPDDEGIGAWRSLTNLVKEYANWIEEQRSKSRSFSDDLRVVAQRHLEKSTLCLDRMNRGIEILRTDPTARRAFKLTNLAMLLQQIATKQLKRRPLSWSQDQNSIKPDSDHQSPWNVYAQSSERTDLGTWRAFQIGFFLMSLDGVINGTSADREVVDLIWFPTGGGKTEAYLAVMAFYMFHQRLLIQADRQALQRDGTNVLMRYTLRMLTTQQFQRAASLVCAMEFLRRNPTTHTLGDIPGIRFSVGLWLGSSASPNTKRQAQSEIEAFRAERIRGNPLILTECPWCRAEIGRYDGSRPRRINQNQWRNLKIRGIVLHLEEGPLLLCPDAKCAFGGERWQDWLPVEVIDERIYDNPPSLVIATADKFAMVAFRPAAGALFGKTITGGNVRQTRIPPGLIVQDELHLISGPLGTIYGLYEAIFERLCSYEVRGHYIKPKLIASTATIRGAEDQTKALYGRDRMELFPSPGLSMSDSYFGKYARRSDGRLSPGRLYLGIHANDYGSILTAQVRAFSSVLFRPAFLEESARDPWWSLLIFYNSIRELSGARTLFDSDIRSRLRFLFNRENVPIPNRRNLRTVEELTSRLTQAEIVGMIDRLSTAYDQSDNNALDVCLASNIIEVGIDIDRLSLMGVVGQPKTTAQYIQVTGRVGRRWWERPGLILTIYNPSKSRDRSHFEQFHTYHRRLYERVEPTSATPFAVSAIQRALPGALIAWSRQHSGASVGNYAEYEEQLDEGYELVQQRCQMVQNAEDQARSIEELERVLRDLKAKWGRNPQDWEEFPPSVNGEYLMLWPGQFATVLQKQNAVTVPSSMRQVDRSGELVITQAYSVARTEEGSKI
jgi:hypothetical protein